MLREVNYGVCRNHRIIKRIFYAKPRGNFEATTKPEHITFFMIRNMTDMTKKLQFQSMNSLRNIADVKTIGNIVC